jgi:hypothetical protein
MLRLSFVVLALLVTSGAVYASAGRSSQRAPVRHSCGLGDRQFIANYQVQMTAVGMFGDDYLHGQAKAQEVIGAARDAARAVRTSAPFDPSLLIVRRYAPAMFLEYGRAVSARAGGRNAAPAMYRSQLLGARVDEVLKEAEPGLTALGCAVADLL